MAFMSLGLICAGSLPLPNGVKLLLLGIWLSVFIPLLGRVLLWTPSSLLALELNETAWSLRLRDGRLLRVLKIQLWGNWLILSAQSGHWLLSRPAVTADCWAALCRQARDYPSA